MYCFSSVVTFLNVSSLNQLGPIEVEEPDVDWAKMAAASKVSVLTS